METPAPVLLTNCLSSVIAMAGCSFGHHLVTSGQWPGGDGRHDGDESPGGFHRLTVGGPRAPVTPHSGLGSPVYGEKSVISRYEEMFV